MLRILVVSVMHPAVPVASYLLGVVTFSSSPCPLHYLFLLFPGDTPPWAQVMLRSHKPALCFLTMLIALGNGCNLHNLSVDMHRYMPRYMPTSAASSSEFPGQAVVVRTLHSPFPSDC